MAECNDDERDFAEEQAVTAQYQEEMSMTPWPPLDARSIGEVEKDTLMFGERRQTITFNLDDLVNLALQRALNDGNGLDWDRDSAVMLDVFGKGSLAEFDGGLEGEVADFIIHWNEETGAIEAKAEHDTMASVSLTIINTGGAA